MNENKTTRNGGLGLISITFLVLLILKLLNVADISWFFVFLPLMIWIGLIVLLIFLQILVKILED